MQLINELGVVTPSQAQDSGFTFTSGDEIERAAIERSSVEGPEQMFEALESEGYEEWLQHTSNPSDLTEARAFISWWIATHI